MNKTHIAMATLGLVLFCTSSNTAQSEPHTDPMKTVLHLGPVGYWPLDESGSSSLRDLSTSANHANAFNAPWDGPLLDFSSAYQFIEIPGSKSYFTEEFTIAAWVFSRRESYGREGVAILGSWPREPLHVSLRLSGENALYVEVVSDGKLDSLGSVAAGVAFAANTWRHLAYTFKKGTGTLYIDGKLVHSKEGVPYTPANVAHPVLAGYDADWWGVHPAASQSLDGSLRHLAIFDRALASDQVEALYTATTPRDEPHLQARDEVRIDGRFIRFADLAKEPPPIQRKALQALLSATRNPKNDSIQQHTTLLQEYLAKSLGEPSLRYDAVLLLQALQANETLDEAPPMLADIVRNPNEPVANRATAALALGAMGGRAQACGAVLRDALEADLVGNAPHIPRVENILRNALIYALLRTQQDDPVARDLLGRAYAKPLLDTVDLDQSDLAEARQLAQSGNFMDALEAAKGFFPNHGEYFLSQNDPYRDARGDIHDRSYTAMAEYKGYTYRFGEGKAYAGCEPIEREVYEEALARYVTQNPEAKDWLGGDISQMRRANLQQIAPDGAITKVFIGGEHFLFSAGDAKVLSWVIAVDKRGYIHIMGGQHNAPDYSNYMPGVWEEMGLSPDPESARYPTKMYWVSTRPEDITEFEFVGASGNPRDVPVTYLNYMNFVQDNHGELFLYGRTDGWGIQSWGLFHYDTEQRTWMPVGGLAGGIIESAKANAPQWMDLVYKGYRGSIPSEGGPRLLAWAWQPHFYNYIRSTRGVRFDPGNRMVVQIAIRGVDENGRYGDVPLFAYSDDNGKTLHRADGSVVQAPITPNPAPAYNAEAGAGLNPLWIMQWEFILAHAGLGN